MKPHAAKVWRGTSATGAHEARSTGMGTSMRKPQHADRQHSQQLGCALKKGRHVTSLAAMATGMGVGEPGGSSDRHKP